MKKLILSLLFLTVQFCIYGQIRSTRDYQYHNGDTYWLEKTNSNLSRSIFTNSSASPSIGTYLAPSGTVSEACGIRVINLIREAGEDPKADNATNPYNNDLAILEVSLYNVYESYGGIYSPSNWSNNYYEVVLLDNNVAQADAATQWNAVMSAGAIAVKKYNETASIDFKSYVNAGNAIITLGIRAQNLSNPWAASDFIFRFKGNVLVDEQISVVVKNNFPGGKIRAQVNNSNPPIVVAPVTISDMTRKTLYMGAVEGANQPMVDGYNRVWNDTEGLSNKSNWYKEYNNEYRGSFSSNVSTSVVLSSSEKNYSYVADMKKLCNIVFQNSFVGVGNGGTVIVNGTQYNSPTSSFQVVEQNAITAEAYGLPLTNGIEYSFSRWNDGNTSSTRIFYPDATTT